MIATATIFHDERQVPRNFTGLVFFKTSSLKWSESFLRYKDGVGVKTNEPCVVFNHEFPTKRYYIDCKEIKEQEFWDHPKLIKLKLNALFAF